MLVLQKLIDPEMDQEARKTVHALRTCAEDVVMEERRPNWMEGSDCDDGSQHSEAHLGARARNQTQGKPNPVPLVIFI